MKKELRQCFDDCVYKMKLIDFYSALDSLWVKLKHADDINMFDSLPIFSLPFCSLLNRFSPMIVAFYKLFHILPRITTMTGRCRMLFCLHLPSYVFNYRLGMFHFAADSLSLSLLTTKNNNMSNQKDCDKRVCLSWSAGVYRVLPAYRKHLITIAV